LVGIDGGVTHRDAGSNAALLVAKGGIEFHQAQEGTAAPPITLIQNWNPEAKQ